MTIRHEQARKRTAGRAFAVLAVFCLNLLVPPCAMALSEIGDGHDCPHCPPSHAEQHAGHAMQQPGHEQHAGAADQTTVVAAPCAGGASDCGMLDDLNVELRPFKSVLGDQPLDSQLVVAGWHEAAAAQRAPTAGQCRAPRSPPPAPSEPLNLLNCVWLD